MVKKIIIIVIMVFVTTLILTQFNNAYCMDFDPDTYKPSDHTSATGADKFQELANNIIGPIGVIGTILSVLTLITIGIKYTMGSVEQKAEYKKTMLPYLIGAIMVFATTNLLQILVNVIGGFW